MADLSKELSKELNKDFAYCEDALGRAENAIGNLPSVQPEKRTEERTETHACDCISRQAAIKAIMGLPTWWADEGGYYGGAQPPMEALLDPKDAVSAIENLPSAQQWIPCSERLPEATGVYIVTCNIYSGDKMDGVTATWSYWRRNEWMMKDVLAWMPLPKPFYATLSNRLMNPYLRETHESQGGLE